MKGVMREISVPGREGARQGQEARAGCIMGSLEILYWSLNITRVIQPRGMG